MTRLLELSSKQQALVSAALRHVRDAEHLLGAEQTVKSPDQAFHLAGFGPECMRKALLSDRVYDRVLGHRIRPGLEVVLDAILALDPVAHRYFPREWSGRWRALGEWTEESRYERTGTRAEVEVRPLVEDARQVVSQTLAALWADGRLPAGFAW